MQREWTILKQTEEMERQIFYQPAERGFEAKIRERIAYWNQLRDKRASDDTDSE